MPWLILAIGVVIGLVLIYRGIGGISPQRQRHMRRVVGGVIALAVLGVIIYLAAVRGGPLLWIVLGLLLPMFLRWRQAGRFFSNIGGPTPGQSSDVETRFLRMKLDHDTGVLDGTVLEGRFAGRRLGEMALEDVIALLHEVRVEDEESAAILEAYLDRVHGAAWRTDDEPRAEDTQGSRCGSGRAQSRGDGMTREEAYEILGLKPGASDEEIKRAHHRMMQKAHPDHGGSNYMATKVNQAKDVLLGG
jgi:DnaJ-domain-containing protein 1